MIEGYEALVGCRFVGTYCGIRVSAAVFKVLKNQPTAEAGNLRMRMDFLRQITQQVRWFSFTGLKHPAADFGRAPRLNSFSFMQFFWENLAKSYVGAPSPRRLAPSPRGNSGSATDIRHSIQGSTYKKFGYNNIRL